MSVGEDLFKAFFENLFRSLGSTFPRGVKAIDALKASTEIRHIAGEIVRDDRLAVDCFFLQMAHNGGRPIAPHNFKYRSIVGGTYDWRALPNFNIDAYKYLELDYEYELLLISIVENKEGFFSPNELSGSQLNVKLRHEGIRFVRYFFLKQSRRAVWYLMIGTTKEGELLNDDLHRYTFNMAVNKIKRIIKKY